MDPVRLAVVGCGDIAKFTALFGRLSRRIKLSAACDTNLEQAQRFARRYGIPQVARDYSALLDSNPDAVYLAVPHYLHFEMVKAAVEAGKAVLVEKPVTRNYAEAAELASLVEESSVKVAVNYQYRYDSGCYALARAVQSGVLGEVNTVRINVPWHRDWGYFSGTAWHQKLAMSGGGTLITQGSHFLDIALWALGGEALSAAGYTAQRKFKDIEVEDVAQGIVEMKGGALVQITSSMVTAREQAATIEVYGNEGTAVYTDRPFLNLRFIGGKRFPRQAPPVRGVHALQRSLEAFASWIQGGPPHLVTVREALPVLAVVEAIYTAARTGQRTGIRSRP